MSHFIAGPEVKCDVRFLRACACLENPKGFSLCFLIPALPFAFQASGKAGLPCFMD